MSSPFHKTRRLLLEVLESREVFNAASPQADNSPAFYVQISYTEPAEESTTTSDDTDENTESTNEQSRNTSLSSLTITGQGAQQNPATVNEAKDIVQSGESALRHAENLTTENLHEYALQRDQTTGNAGTLSKLEKEWLPDNYKDVRFSRQQIQTMRQRLAEFGDSAKRSEATKNYRQMLQKVEALVDSAQIAEHSASVAQGMAYELKPQRDLAKTALKLASKQVDQLEERYSAAKEKHGPKDSHTTAAKEKLQSGRKIESEARATYKEVQRKYDAASNEVVRLRKFAASQRQLAADQISPYLLVIERGISGDVKGVLSGESEGEKLAKLELQLTEFKASFFQSNNAAKRLGDFLGWFGVALDTFDLIGAEMKRSEVWNQDRAGYGKAARELGVKSIATGIGLVPTGIGLLVSAGGITISPVTGPLGGTAAVGGLFWSVGSSLFAENWSDSQFGDIIEAGALAYWDREHGLIPSRSQ